MAQRASHLNDGPRCLTHHGARKFRLSGNAVWRRAAARQRGKRRRTSSFVIVFSKGNPRRRLRGNSAADIGRSAALIGLRVADASPAATAEDLFAGHTSDDGGIRRNRRGGSRGSGNIDGWLSDGWACGQDVNGNSQRRRC
jgi:hypothetical protein